METLLQDLRFGMRTLIKQPGFALVALITLALGIGANTAIFSVINAVLLNPFSFPDHERLMVVRQSMPKINMKDNMRFSGSELTDLRENTSTFEALESWEPVSRNLTGGEVPERVAAAKVTGGFFNMLGVAPQLGRAIKPEDEGPKGERVLLITHGLWQRRFGGDAGVLGKKVSLDDEPYTIIGVMPPSFRFEESEAWFAFPFEMKDRPRHERPLLTIGKLKQGVSID